LADRGAAITLFKRTDCPEEERNGEKRDRRTGEGGRSKDTHPARAKGEKSSIR